MVKMANFTTLAAAGAVALLAGLTAATPTAEAGTCKPPMRGSATGQGLFGKGTAEARRLARYDWESRASIVYGDAYGNFDKSRRVSWDCKKGAILKAKCTVIARPCK
jgi:hypothetical protein